MGGTKSLPGGDDGYDADDKWGFQAWNTALMAWNVHLAEKGLTLDEIGTEGTQVQLNEVTLDSKEDAAKHDT